MNKELVFRIVPSLAVVIACVLLLKETITPTVYFVLISPFVLLYAWGRIKR
ncbi:hypothetical protein ACVLD2_000630 [Paenibacillus sp. PvR052]|uniref:hypothetical protein n=1 Tax=Paenibacillus sp. PvP091 TaxID=2806590 RepID=UPI001AE111B2|nr:hypothetical protein [Paenibacillus sp. PvP091]MBP1155457.1 hypothetical protein [Paenibacillus sp. PvP091]MBP1169158.1 hypothetical protein [Paenibacillus sp. PvR098]MBP2440186.1 hypothetical protein [Paenibacillus sp. PvP052]